MEDGVAAKEAGVTAMLVVKVGEGVGVGERGGRGGRWGLARIRHGGEGGWVLLLEDSEGEEHGDFFSGDVFGGGSGAGVAYFVAGPFFEGVGEEAGFCGGVDVGGDGLVEGPGVFAPPGEAGGGFTGVGEDGFFAGGEVFVDAAELGSPAAAGLVGEPAPVGGFGGAEGGVHHDDDEGSAGLEGAGDGVEDGLGGVDVLDGEEADGVVEGAGGDVLELGGVVEDVADGGRRGAEC